MTIAELELAAAFLDLASDAFSNHGCNDWDWPEGWDDESKMRLLSQPNLGVDPTDYLRRGPPDWLVMTALAKRLRQQAGTLEPSP